MATKQARVQTLRDGLFNASRTDAEQTLHAAGHECTAPHLYQHSLPCTGILRRALRHPQHEQQQHANTVCKHSHNQVLYNVRHRLSFGKDRHSVGRHKLARESDCCNKYQMAVMDLGCQFGIDFESLFHSRTKRRRLRGGCYDIRYTG